MSKDFTKTRHCTSRAHCQTCRDQENGRAWRGQLETVYSLPDGEVDFVCPYGGEWGEPPSWLWFWQTQNGLGDTVAAVLKSVGIKPWPGCGCSGRIRLLNMIVPYNRHVWRRRIIRLFTIRIDVGGYTESTNSTEGADHG